MLSTGNPAPSGDDAGSPAIRLRGVVALLGSFPALAGADLEVERGEITVLRGPNGAGKTTLLRVCAGLVPLTTGAAEVLGCDLTADRRAVRRRIGLLGHAAHLYDDLTAEENLRFAVRASGARIASAAFFLEKVGLTGRIVSTRASALSAGQRRRVALAALMARAPDVLLLDEPHAGLDAPSREVLDEVVIGAARSGAAVVLASHEADVAERLPASIALMQGGRVVSRSAVSRSVTATRNDAADDTEVHPVEARGGGTRVA